MKDNVNEMKYMEHLLRHVELVQQNSIILGKRLIEEGRPEMGRRVIMNGMLHDVNKFSGIVWDYLMATHGLKKLNKDQKCKFHLKSKDKAKATASLDRIDQNKGYEIGNVQWVHKDVNLMKMYLDEKYFIGLCGKIYELNKGRK